MTTANKMRDSGQVNWQDFKEYIESKYSQTYQSLLWSYCRKYSALLFVEDPKEVLKIEKLETKFRYICEVATCSNVEFNNSDVICYCTISIPKDMPSSILYPQIYPQIIA